MRIRFLIFGVIIGFVCIFFIQNSIDREKGKYHLLTELLYFPSGRFVEEVSIGYHEMVADLVWLRAIQYFGEHHLTDLKFEHLYHILDILTTLDKKFIHAYTFGGLLLEHSAREPDNTDLLLHKGEYYNPRSWEIPFIRGFISYIFRYKAKESAAYFMRAAGKPNAPDMCKRFAGFTYQKMGDAYMAFRLWEDIYRESNNHLEKETAFRSMQEMLMLMEMDSLNAAIMRFTKDEERIPGSIEEIVARRYLREMVLPPWEDERFYIRREFSKAWCTYLDRTRSPILFRMLVERGYPITRERYLDRKDTPSDDGSIRGNQKESNDYGE
jgi:hypothetical protein